MTANRPSTAYIAVRLIAITLLVVPVVNGVYTMLAFYIFHPGDRFDVRFVFLVMGFTMIYYTWIMLLTVFIPYCWLFYSYVQDKPLWLKMGVFYGLLLVSGLIFREASVLGSYVIDAYPAAFVLYLLLTVTLCPLLNATLGKVVNNQQASDGPR